MHLHTGPAYPVRPNHFNQVEAGRDENGAPKASQGHSTGRDFSGCSSSVGEKRLWLQCGHRLVRGNGEM